MRLNAVSHSSRVMTDRAPCRRCQQTDRVLAERQTHGVGIHKRDSRTLWAQSAFADTTWGRMADDWPDCHAPRTMGAS